MKKILAMALLSMTLAACASNPTDNGLAADPASPMVETIVCIRHGEKPQGGLGQLTCQGLNRSLALPQVLLGHYGTPQFIFAPNPSEQVDGTSGALYYYVRPLATIEPTAIQCGLPVNTHYGYRAIDRLESELNQPKYRNAVVFVAWEHALLATFAKHMLKDHGEDPRRVPEWAGDDYDTIFVFKITTQNGRKTFSFTIDHEGLNALSTGYPIVPGD